jgi:NAD(P)-dependent dehydrogenase (short-subunit alcohol dehydrogenase family)
VIVREEHSMGRLEDKVAVITGGASGIGRRSVERFLEEGCRVVIADIQDELGQELEKAADGAAVYRHVDVSREDDVAAAVAFAVDRFGRLDCMFNNAGFGGVTGPFHQTDMGAAYDATIAVNLTGAILGMKHAAAHMLSQRSGSIINTSSAGGIQGGLGAHVYSACKAGVIGITRSVALELAPSKIRVNSICPGGIATNILAGLFSPEELASDGAEELIRPFLADFQPIARAGEADDVAHMAVYLASDESSFVTGQALVVDGGASSTNPGLFALARAVRAVRRERKARDEGT